MDPLEMTRCVFSAENEGVHPCWRGFVVDRVADMAWLRLHETCEWTDGVTVHPVPDTSVQVVTAGGKLAGFAFSDASRHLPPSLLVPGAPVNLQVEVHHVPDMLLVRLLDDNPHPHTRRSLFHFLAGERPCRGQVVVEPSGLLSRIVVHPASAAAPTGMVRQLRGIARVWLSLRRGAWRARSRMIGALGKRRR